MPKYSGKQIFAHVRFLKVGQKQKTEKEKRERERERKLVITMASYALQHHLVWRTQSRLGQFWKFNSFVTQSTFVPLALRIAEKSLSLNYFCSFSTTVVFLSLGLDKFTVSI